MDQGTVTDVIHFLKESLIRSGIRVDSIALFGSALAGDMTEDSDIDLIVISEDFAQKDLFERAKMTMIAEIQAVKMFKIPLDIVNMSPAEFEISNIRLFYKTKIVA